MSVPSPGDVNGLFGTVDRVLAVFGIVARAGAIDGLRGEPQAWGHHLGRDSFAIESRLRSSLASWSTWREDFESMSGDGIVVVEHHRLESGF